MITTSGNHTGGTTSSCRIELQGQTTSSFNVSSTVSIDRSIPALLGDRMSNQEWISFCDNVDQALEPAQTIRKQLACCTFLSVAASIGIFIAIAVMGATGRIFSIGSGGGFNPVYIVLFIAFIVAPTSIQCYIIKKRSEGLSKVYDDLRTVINAESSKRSDISFHLREDTSVRYYSSSTSNTHRLHTSTIYYIECNVRLAGAGHSSNDGGNAFQHIPTVASPVVMSSLFDSISGGGGGNSSATTMAKSGGKSTLERLQELEGIKSLISEEEYNNKRNAILSAL